jgi:hypothetical protein
MSEPKAVEQLNGRYRRLKAELVSARAQQPLPIGIIDRLVAEISEAERAIAAIAAQRIATFANDVAKASPDEVPAGVSTSAPGDVRPAARSSSVPRTRLLPSERACLKRRAISCGDDLGALHDKVLANVPQTASRGTLALSRWSVDILRRRGPRLPGARVCRGNNGSSPALRSGYLYPS